MTDKPKNRSSTILTGNTNVTSGSESNVVPFPSPSDDNIERLPVNRNKPMHIEETPK